MRRLMMLTTALTLLVTAATFAAPVAVRGTVRTADRTALAEARVELIPLVSNFEWTRRVLDEGHTSAAAVTTTKTDAAGRFSLVPPRPGMWRVVVRARGFVPMDYFPLPSSNPTELPPVVLLPDAGVPIATLDSSRRPVAGAWVLARTASQSLWRELATNGWQVGRRMARSDERGRLVLPRAEGERLHLTASLPGSAVLSHARDVEEATMVLETSMVTQRVIEVRGAKDQPIAGLVVAVGSMAFPAGRTGEDGTLELTCELPSLVLLRFFAEDGRQHREVLKSFREQEDPRPRYVFPEPLHVAGRVVDASGKRPLAAALVWPRHDPGLFVLTDEKGGFEIVASPGEDLWVQAEATGFLAQSQRLSIAERAPTLALTAAVAVNGQVVDDDGVPLPGVHLEAVGVFSPQQARALLPDRVDSRSLSGLQGRFTLGNLHPDGTYELTAAKAGFVTSRLTVSDPAHSGKKLRIRLEQNRPAFGRVVDLEDEPVPGVEVKLRAAGESARRQAPATALTDEAGLFEVEKVPAFRLDMAARKKGFSPITVRGVEISPGEGAIDLGTLVLAPGARIEGWITDPAGEPIQEAKVWVAPDLGRPSRAATERIRHQEPDAVSDADGRFLVEDLRAGQKVHLLFGRTGYLPTSVLGVEAPNSEPIEVVLHPASTVSGEVVDQNDEAVAGARVRLEGQALPPGTMAPRRGSENMHSAICDEQGYFVFPEVAPGEVEIEASAEGFLPAPPLLLEIPENESVDDLRFVLERGHAVAGLVSNREGEPVAGARILAHRSVTSSGRDGRYRLEGVPLGRQALEARHREYNRVVREVEIEPGLNNADFVLTGGWPVSGEVLDEDGSPVGGARVELRLRGREYREYRVISGAGGRFTFPRVANGGYDIKVEKAGYAPTELARAFEVSGGPVDGVEVRLRKGAAIAGRIRGLELDELAAVRVRARSSGQSGGDGTVDYQGGYEIADLGPGDWLVRAWLPGGSSQVEVRVVIESGIRRVLRDLDFGGNLTLVGHVLFRGEPLSETNVSVIGHDVAVRRSVLTDHQGGFRIEGLEAGRYRLGLSNPREMLLYNEEIEVWGDRELNLELATARLSGVVLSGATSRPLANAAVALLRLLGEDGSQTGSLITVTTGPEGSFHLAQLTAGRYRLSVHRDGYTPIERILNVEAGADLDGLELALAPAEGLDLVVRLASGQAPRSATVAVFDASDRLLQSETREVAEEGSTRFSTIPAGTWELVVSAPGGAATRTVATVPGTPIELVLPPASRLIVRVLPLVESNLVASLTLVGQDGRSFQIVEPSGALRREWSLIGGSGTIEDVPAGVWVLRVVTPDGRSWERTAATTGSPEIELILE